MTDHYPFASIVEADPDLARQLSELRAADEVLRRKVARLWNFIIVYSLAFTLIWGAVLWFLEAR